MADSTVPGRFVWFDLMTTDPDAAVAFYTRVVGWGTTTFESEKGPYTMWTANETPIGGVMRLPPEATAAGAGPYWLGYISTPDANATTARARELGARVWVGPADIPNVGRFSIMTDPQGAHFAAFQPTGVAPAAAAEPKPGEVSWDELATTDHEAAFRFYSELFGWQETEAMDMGPMGIYQMFGLDGQTMGAMYDKPAEMPGPPVWTFYVGVPDIEAAARATTEAGGQIINGPMEVPGGDMIIMGVDPQGVPFAAHQRKR
ncbi:MAG TPA: VOC family protein [Longimicrobiales bacterium]|nr:VOC family protein [Longimicrobiales bacterium]